MSFEAGASAVFGLSPLSWPMPLSGILAALVDLDHIELQPLRTPLAHSVAGAALWVYSAGAVAAFASPEALPGTVLSAGCAFISHLALDALTPEGIFLWPYGRRPAEWLRPLPDSAVFWHGGHAFVAQNEGEWQGLLDGESAWPAWRRLRLGRALPARLRPGGATAEVLMSSLGLAGVLLAIMAG
jgi:hypothetical protein